jgi:hypothetical protein
VKVKTLKTGERTLRRRDRKRRNQRIAAGVVGITILGAVLWIVTSGAHSIGRTIAQFASGAQVCLASDEPVGR